MQNPEVQLPHDLRRMLPQTLMVMEGKRYCVRICATPESYSDSLCVWQLPAAAVEDFTLLHPHVCTKDCREGNLRGTDQEQAALS